MDRRAIVPMTAGALVTLMLLLTVLDAAAADKWTGVRSKNFNLVGNATEAQLRAAALDLEEFREAFIQLFPSAANAVTVPITVVVFKSDESYRPFKPLVAGRPMNVTGYFQAAEDVNYISLTAGLPIPREVYNQYAQQLLRDVPVTLPLWFIEGVADFYSTFEIPAKDKKSAVGQAIPEYVDVFRRAPLVSFNDLFKWDRSSPQYNETGKGIYYAESWALANYLIAGPNGYRVEQMTQFLDLLAKDKPLPESFQKAFETDYGAMQHELENYVRDRRVWPPFQSELREKSEIDKELKVRTLSEAESEFDSGDLLLHISRLLEAETHLKQAIVLNPAMSSATAALGMAQFRLDEVQDALKLLKHAIELDPKNYLANYDYAFVLDKSSNSVSDDLDIKRKALEKTIELNPQYIPAYELLAYLNLTEGIDYDGTLRFLQKARTYMPGNPNLSFLLAQVLVKKQDFDSAGSILGMLAGNSSVDTALREGAQTLINFIARSRETGGRTAVVEEAAKPPVIAANAPPPPPAATTARNSNELELISPQRPRPEGTHVSGLLTLMDCRNGMTLTLKTAERTMTLHTDTPAQVQFFSNVPSINTSIQCGPTPGSGIPVIVTYKPTPGGPSAGEPLFVEFVEKLR